MWQVLVDMYSYSQKKNHLKGNNSSIESLNRSIKSESNTHTELTNTLENIRVNISYGSLEERKTNISVLGEITPTISMIGY